MNPLQVTPHHQFHRPFSPWRTKPVWIFLRSASHALGPLLQHLSNTVCLTFFKAFLRIGSCYVQTFRCLSVSEEKKTHVTFHFICVSRLHGHLVVVFLCRKYEGVSKSFQTRCLERELQMVQLFSNNRCSCITSLWVSLVSFAAIILCVASQRVFFVLVYFVIDSGWKLLDAPL
jgi:hypothetical protein